MFVSEEKANEFSRSVARPGDLIFTCWGTIDQIGLIDGRAKYSQYIVSNKQMLLTPDPARANSLFLYYAFSAPTARAEILNRGIGSSVPGFNLGQLRSFDIPLPPLPQQRAIAYILGTLDDKIELNRQHNETLAAMARVLFKDWFVDFGPVRAKMEGREPYLDADTWALFPDLLDGDGRPKGWQEATLANLSALNPESWSAREPPDSVEYVDLANTKRGLIESTVTHTWDSAPSRARRVLRPGDTIVGTVRPGNQSFALVPSEGLTGSTGFAVLRPLTPDCRELVYLAATASENIDRLAQLADGAAYPAVRPDVVSATPIVLPKADEAVGSIRGEFSRLTRDIFDSAALAHRESQTLAGLRDTLLPKLISGELRIPNPEQFLAERGL